MAMKDLNTVPTPLNSYSGTVQKEWIDDNNHMNVAYYVLAFDFATDALFNFVGLSSDYKLRNRVSTFAVDMNVSYKHELRLGEAFRIETRLIDCSNKALHYFHEMYHAEDSFLAATNEVLSMHMNMEIRRIAPMAPDIQARVSNVCKIHNSLDCPQTVGRTIGIRQKKVGIDR
ncbi:MAG: thioesterase-like protein [Rhodospirillaceae bacterium]|nr:thioesterase-like protein [Rhodospirillaceae bacterium]